MKKNIFIISVFSFMLLLNSSVSLAASNFKIAAKVNDDIITTKDLKDRFGFIIVTSQIKYSAKNREAILMQILQKMIDEKLQQQEANRLGIFIDSKIVNQEIAKIESSQGIPKGALKEMLASEDIPYRTYYEQIYTQILWSKFVVTNLGSNINISNAEIEEYLELINKKPKITKFLLSEIYIPLDSSKKDAKEIAKELVLQIKEKGKSFDKIAKNFSKDTLTTNSSGKQWVYEKDLDKKVLKVIQKLEVGDITEPILVKEKQQGYYIFRLDNKKNDDNINNKEIEQIKNGLFYNKLETAARDYILNLRRNAYIEIVEIKI